MAEPVIIEAAINGDRTLVLEAMMADPMAGQPQTGTRPLAASSTSGRQSIVPRPLSSARPP